MTARKKLPIGIQTFREIREENYYYVDKTPFVLDLINQGKYYFLSRPRRFGKSLLVDTFKDLFEGSRELFTGLHAEENWDWSIKYPVLNFSFAGGGTGSLSALQLSLDRQLSRYEKKWSVTPLFADAGNRFSELIFHIHEKSGQKVVVLVDEYDKPILDAISDRDVALANREALRDFYSVIKDNDAYVHFAFLTGVSKFSKAGIFSGLNNLRDITVNARYSAICGYTDSDLGSVFAPELEGADRDEIREWYNGYNWLGEKVYNPYDLLLFFAEGSIAPYWFESGTPSFLIKLLLERGVFTPDLDKTLATEMLLSTFDVETMPIEAFLFQTGYLTVDKVEVMAGSRFFRLCFPNKEVYQSLNICLAASFLGDPGRENQARFDLAVILQNLKDDLSGLESHLRSLFASIPFDWHRKNEIARYEGYYASIFYSHFAALGLDIRVEDSTNRGRIDMTVLFEGRVLIFEFNVVELEPQGRAMEQLMEKDYAAKYLDRCETVFLIGIEFSREKREIVGFESQTLN